MTNALMLMPTGDEWGVMTQQANILVKSGFLPQSIKSAEQALAIMLKGRELGIPPWAALTSIHIIQGSPTISPQLMLALIERSGQLENVIIEAKDNQCSVTLQRKGRKAHTETFSQNDAERMGLAGKDNWKKQPKTMIKWRAISACARVVFPDVLLGMYTPEEINPDGSYNDDGEIIPGSFTVVLDDKPANAPTTGAKGSPVVPTDNGDEVRAKSPFEGVTMISLPQALAARAAELVAQDPSKGEVVDWPKFEAAIDKILPKYKWYDFVKAMYQLASSKDTTRAQGAALMEWHRANPGAAMTLFNGWLDANQSDAAADMGIPLPPKAAKPQEVDLAEVFPRADEQPTVTKQIPFGDGTIEYEEAA